MSAISHDIATAWHDLLSRVRIAEHSYNALIDAILRDHGEQHAGPVRWCGAMPCQLAEQARRTEADRR